MNPALQPGPTPPRVPVGFLSFKSDPERSNFYLMFWRHYQHGRLILNGSPWELHDRIRTIHEANDQPSERPA